MSPRDALLRGPVARRLLGLALPILIVLAVQTLVSVAETYFVGFLGDDALAGVALVFPVLMLMTMMSNGGIGGGVASAIARAIGAGRMRDAEALATHSVLIAIVFGVVFTAAAVGGGPALFSALGGRDEVLVNALRYSTLVFGAAVPIWVVNLLAAALRGAGNVRVPAILTAAGAAMTLGLSPLLIFGWGPVPRFGVAGAGLAMIVYYVTAMMALIAYMRSAQTPIRLVPTRIRWRLLKDILGVGALSAIGTVVANLTVVLATGFVGGFGGAAIAGYGMASRLDYLLIPLLFALGTASLTMVGTNVGAGQMPRARRIAWTAALLSAGATGVIGLAAAFAPSAWLGLFSDTPEVIRIGASYLHRAAPFYACYGLGMALYFASQGAGSVLWPFIAGCLRLALVAGGGWYWVKVLQGSLDGLFWIIAASLILFAVVNVAAFATGLSWSRLASPPSAGRRSPVVSLR
ncbi:MAG TPA: MATE family efflux transporter [Casimicrobiaceae bacterium]|nr:MATE family efflux transporter [Casimicrobiaceae bacterium]